MTWVRIADGAPVQVSAHRVDFNGSPQVQLTLNGQAAFLSEDDAASLGGFLLGSTKNGEPEAQAPNPEGGTD